MKEDLHIDDVMRHAYVDGRLNAEQQKTMNQYLAAHPQEARELDAWRKDAAQLQAAWQSADPPINPALDPAAIRMRLKERTNMRWKLAASIFVALCIGGVGMAAASRADCAIGPGSSPVAHAGCHCCISCLCR